MKTDSKIPLRKKEKVEVAPPNRILIVSPTANGCDQILDKLKTLNKSVKIVRLGQSHSRPDLDKKYGININPKQENASILV